MSVQAENYLSDRLYVLTSETNGEELQDDVSWGMLKEEIIDAYDAGYDRARDEIDEAMARRR